jgi:hypothetical protein
MIPLALALVLAAAPPRQPSAPAQGEWEIEEVEPVSEDEMRELLKERMGSPFPRFFRAGARTSRLLDTPGYAAGGEVGLEIKLRDWLGLRAGFSTALRQDWGTLTVAPELAFYPLPWSRSSVAPYLAVGLQAGVVNLTGAERRTGRASAGLAVLRAAASSAGPADVPMDKGGGALGPTPLAFSFGPQATAGALLWLTRTVALDVGLRYESIRWHGERYGGLGAVASILAPF